jgi:hypothetical protein
VQAEDVDLASWVTEERAESSQYVAVGMFADAAALLPVDVGHDEEQVLGVRGDVGLPQVLQVVVVGGGPSALDLNDDPAAGPEAADEVGSGAGDETVLRREDDLLAEPELLAQQVGNDGLHGPGLGAVDVDEVDARGLRRQVVCE